MKRLLLDSKHTIARLSFLGAVLGIVFSVTPNWSSARSTSTAITITNNTGLTIRHVYLSPVNQNAWGPDQLNNSVIGPGGSVTISANCDGSIRVIAEDQDGCFLSAVVTCSATAAWTITNTTARDCD